MLTREHKERLELFNEVADRVIHSDFAKESKQKQIGGRFTWNMEGRPPDNPDFSFSRKSHNQTFTEAVILYVRRLIQNNDDASIGNLGKSYDEMPIHTDYKMDFCNLRGHLNQYLDSPTIMSVNGRPTRRDILYAFIYGKFAHSGGDEKEMLKLWKEQPPDWNLAYFHLEETLHDFILTVNAIKELNERVLKYC